MVENWPHENSWLSDPLINYWLFVFLIGWPLFKLSKRTGVDFWKMLPILIPYIGMVIVVGVLAHSTWQNKESAQNIQQRIAKK